MLFWALILVVAGEAPAGAWGPATHLDLGLRILREAALLAPAVALLLRRYPLDFLYGNLAADITVGKNLSPYALHCHNWKVAHSILELAESDATRAFAWGYLSHLAADIVAHNYFIPYKMVQHLHRRRTAHVYWEIRFDTWVGEETWQVARKLSTRAFRSHDRHLRNIIIGPLFSFPVNKQIFNSMMLANRVLRWRRAVRAVQRNQRLILGAEEVEQSRRLSLQRMQLLLQRGLVPELQQADPTGHRNLLIARQLHRDLHRLYRSGMLDPGPEVAETYRPLFLAALDGKLELPPATQLAAAWSTSAGEQATRRPSLSAQLRRRARALLSGARRRWHKPRLRRAQRRRD